MSDNDSMTSEREGVRGLVALAESWEQWAQDETGWTCGDTPPTVLKLCARELRRYLEALPTPPADAEQRARELLYADSAFAWPAQQYKAALRAIVTALTQQPDPKAVLSEPDRIGLYQGPDDCPQLMVNDRAVAIFPAGSWAKVCDALDSITGSDPKPEATDDEDDCPRLRYWRDRAVRAEAFSFSMSPGPGPQKGCRLDAAGNPKPEARGVVDEAIKAALAELDALRGAMFKTYAAAANGADKSKLLALIEAERNAYENHYSQPLLQAALTEARNVR